MFAGQGRLEAALHKELTGPCDGVDAGVECFGDLTIAPAVSGLRGVRLEQDARLEQLTRRPLALLDQCIQPIALVGAELDDVFLDARLFRGHDASPQLPEPSIQRSAAESTTDGTRGLPRLERRFGSGGRDIDPVGVLQADRHPEFREVTATPRSSGWCHCAYADRADRAFADVWSAPGQSSNLTPPSEAPIWSNALK